MFRFRHRHAFTHILLAERFDGADRYADFIGDRREGLSFIAQLLDSCFLFAGHSLPPSFRLWVQEGGLPAEITRPRPLFVVLVRDDRALVIEGEYLLA